MSGKNSRRMVFLMATLLACSARAGLDQNSLNSIMNVVGGVAKSQEVASMSEQDEITIGRDLALRTLGSYPVIRDNKLQRYLNRVGMWVALQSSRPGLPWHFAAVESAQINAFAVPGGTVLVTRGMLNLVANEAELACVIGHEIGHVTRKHHLELLQKEMLLKTGSDALTTQVNMDDTKKFISSHGNELFSRALDRSAESDADGDGVLLAARAGYDPEACRSFIQRMADLKQDSGALAALYKTHPRPADRVNDVVGAIAALNGIAPGSGAQPPLGYQKPH